jgi:Mrp family chromosome partitioning ATPase
MAKYPKETEMKDSLFEDELSGFVGQDFVGSDFLDSELDNATSRPSGMRHSIRPRRMRKVVAAPKAAQPAPKAAQPPAAPRAPEIITPAIAAPATSTPEMTSSQPPEQAQAPVVATPIIAAPAMICGWDDLHRVNAGGRKGARASIPVVDMERDTTSNRAFDLLRTRLRQTTQEKNWINIGVTAPTTGCGATFTAVNLALSLSRVEASRTVLMDMNLRDPGVMDTFDIAAPGDMGDYLSGDVAMTEHLMRISDTLALGLNASPDDTAAETLQHRSTHETLAEMRRSLAPELVIYDLPPMLVSDDVSAFVPQLDAVLLVSDGTQTTASQLLECERMLDGQVPLLGVVLNRARASSIQRYT